MRKLLTLLVLLCMVCTGAWAEIVQITKSSNFNDLTAGREVYFTMQESPNKYFSGTALVDALSNDCWFTLEASGSNFKFKNRNGEYVKVELNNHTSQGADSSTFSLVSSSNEASDFSFSNQNGGFSGFKILVACSETHPHNYSHHVLLNSGSTLNTFFYDNTIASQSWKFVSWFAYYDNSPSGPTEGEITALQNKINDAVTNMAWSFVGYPKYQTETALNLSNNYFNLVTASNYEQALSAYNDVLAETDINLPENGRMYVFTNIATDKSKHYLYEDTSNDKLLWALRDGNTATEDLPNNAKYICRVVDGRYTFVNEATGHYLIWRGSNAGVNNNKGYMTDYNATDCTLAVKRAVYSNSYQGNAKGQEDFFGCVVIEGKRSSNDVCFLYSTGGTDNFNQDGSTDVMRYGDGHSAIFTIEVVENPNKVKLTRPTTIVHDNHGLNGKYVGTFSAPYHVELPDGVVAYTADVNASGNTVVFNELGNIVPKNIGVVVYAEHATENITTDAVPAIETTNVDDANLLVGTNGSEVTVDSKINAYILSADMTNGVKFYILDENNRTLARNKAYLDLSSSSSVNAFRFDFEEEQTTRVEAVGTQLNKKQAFDLSGRSVNARMRGLYIIGGQKVIR